MLQALFPCSRPCGANGVGSGHNQGFDGAAVVLVMLNNGPANIRVDSVLLGDIVADFYMAALYLMGHGLTDVVEESSRLGYLYVGSDLRGDHPRQQRYLHRVLQDVLTVAVAVLQAAQELLKLRVEPLYTGIKGSLLSRLVYGLLNFYLGFTNHILDTGRMDASVLDELL